MKYKTITMLMLVLTVAGCSEPNHFEQTFEKPAWFDTVEAQSLQSSSDVSALWQSEKRCCEDENTLLQNNRIFYKSCFNAIVDHYDDEELVVKCLWLMDVGAESEHKVALSRFLVDNFPHHRNDISNCANCMPADTVARVTLTLARHESRSTNDKKLPVDRIETLMDARKDEISYWVQAEIYAFLGKLYLEDGVTDERFQRFNAAYERLNRARLHNEPLARRFAQVENRYRQVSQAAEGR